MPWAKGSTKGQFLHYDHKEIGILRARIFSLTPSLQPCQLGRSFFESLSCSSLSTPFGTRGQLQHESLDLNPCQWTIKSTFSSARDSFGTMFNSCSFSVPCSFSFAVPFAGGISPRGGSTIAQRQWEALLDQFFTFSLVYGAGDFVLGLFNVPVPFVYNLTFSTWPYPPYSLGAAYQLFTDPANLGHSL